MLYKYQTVILVFSVIVTAETEDLHEFLGLNIPIFNNHAELVFTSQEGGTAYMTCEVYNLNNNTVSWLRESDRHILTVGRETFISDRRFVALHTRTQISDVLTLSILHVTPQDAGNYQCQVSSPNKISKSVELLVIRPQVKILGGHDIHVKEGSKVILKCLITNYVEKPPYVTWYLNNKMLVDFIGSQSSLTHKPSYSLSNLYLNNVQMSDIGNYTCQPSGLNKVTASLYVLKAEKEQKLIVKESSSIAVSTTTFFCNQFRLISFVIFLKAAIFCWF